REIRLWSSLKHQNIIPFLGVCFFPTGDPASDAFFSLVSPWMRNGTSCEYIASHSDVDKIAMFLGAAEGLLYLHETGIVHGDLKGSNILINENGQPVLADFGLARLSNPDGAFASDRLTSSSSLLSGTCRWTAPELINEPDLYPGPTIPSDVWSFGCVMLELLFQKVPYFHRRQSVLVIIAIMRGELP
ncbi:kinase-like protein, partial [Sistotremastrum niveocremeum HHB9708]